MSHSRAANIREIEIPFMKKTKNYSYPKAVNLTEI